MCLSPRSGFVRQRHRVEAMEIKTGGTPHFPFSRCWLDRVEKKVVPLEGVCGSCSSAFAFLSALQQLERLQTRTDNAGAVAVL